MPKGTLDAQSYTNTDQQSDANITNSNKAVILLEPFDIVVRYLQATEHSNDQSKSRQMSSNRRKRHLRDSFDSDLDYSSNKRSFIVDY